MNAGSHPFTWTEKEHSPDDQGEEIDETPCKGLVAQEGYTIVNPAVSIVGLKNYFRSTTK